MLISKRDEREKRGASQDEIIAFLGKGTRFKGVVTYEGTVRIDGHIEGEIVSSGALVVGESAGIDAGGSGGGGGRERRGGKGKGWGGGGGRGARGAGGGSGGAERRCRWAASSAAG